MYLITKWFGVFLCDKGGIKNKVLFPKDEGKIAKRLSKIDKKEILSEEKRITKNKKVIVSEKRLQKVGEFKPTDPFFKEFDINPEDFDFSDELLHKATLIITKDKVDFKLAGEDLQIIQMVNTLDDLIQTSNLLSERMECWSIIPYSIDKIKPLQNTISTVYNEMKMLENQIDQDMQNIAPNINNTNAPT